MFLLHVRADLSVTFQTGETRPTVHSWPPAARSGPIRSQFSDDQRYEWSGHSLGRKDY